MELLRHLSVRLHTVRVPEPQGFGMFRGLSFFQLPWFLRHTQVTSPADQVCSPAAPWSRRRAGVSFLDNCSSRHQRSAHFFLKWSDSKCFGRCQPSDVCHRRHFRHRAQTQPQTVCKRMAGAGFQWVLINENRREAGGMCFADPDPSDAGWFPVQCFCHRQLCRKHFLSITN